MANDASQTAISAPSLLMQSQAGGGGDVVGRGSGNGAALLDGVVPLSLTVSCGSLRIRRRDSGGLVSPTLGAAVAAALSGSSASAGVGMSATTPASRQLSSDQLAAALQDLAGGEYDTRGKEHGYGGFRNLLSSDDGSNSDDSSGVDDDGGACDTYREWHESVTVLFADIVGYTSMSHSTPPEKIMKVSGVHVCVPSTLTVIPDGGGTRLC